MCIRDRDNYLFVVRPGTVKDQFGVDTFSAEVVFVDGTSKVITVDKVGGNKPSATSDLPRGVYSYKYDEDDDEYALTLVNKTGGNMTFKKGNTDLGNPNRANGKTVFVYIDTKVGGALDSADSYTGYRNAPSITVVDGAYICLLYTSRCV